MPKAGRYDYPFFDIDHSLDRLKAFYEVAQTDQIERNVVADALGMAEKGGGFAYLISSMEKYGLIQTGGGNITVTDLGKLAMYGEASEIEQAKRKAVTGVELFSELHERYGKNPQLEQIRLFLREKANLDVTEAKKMAKKVDKIYKKVSNYISSAKKLVEPSPIPIKKAPSAGRGEPIVQPESAKGELLKIQLGDFYIQVKKEDAEEALRYVAQKLGIDLSVKKAD